MCVFDYARTNRFRCYDFDLDPMTLIYVFDLYIPKMYLCTKNEVTGQRLSKLEHEEDRQTDATERITTAVFAAGNVVIPKHIENEVC